MSANTHADNSLEPARSQLFVEQQLQDEVNSWIEDDPDRHDRAELERLLSAALAGNDQALADLRERFSAPLTFGTAGLRGKMRAGPHGMNIAVVLRATAGLARWLQEKGHRGSTIVVGCDARHHSADFAYAVSEVFSAAGFHVMALPPGLPTPLTAFATRRWAAAAGVQITASHNPAWDNGYKVFLGSEDPTDAGAQLIPPADREIESAIAAVGPARSIPRQAWQNPPTVSAAITEYLDRIDTLGHSESHQRAAVRIVLTPLHGVGGEVACEALRRAGFSDIHVVSQQFAPDPDFPTVEFPNPEEKGATDLLCELAQQVNADLAVALDPDADRCALAIPDSSSGSSTGWRMLSGDETGVLLGGWILENSPTENPLTASTLVSSRQLEALAQQRLTRHVRTLTGFKWLVRAQPGLVYAYEEAIGHCVDPDAVRDKDGISAAVLAADLVAHLKANGRTIPQLQEEYALELGLYRTTQVSLRFAHRAGIGDTMHQLRREPPSTLAGESVTVEDLLKASPKYATDAIQMEGEGLRVVVRPSGTEPKLKIYVEVTQPVPDREDLAEAREVLKERIEEITAWAHSLLR